MNVAVQPARTVTRSADDPNDDAFGLPAWIYRDPDFFELEKRSIFRTSWQLVCHGNDMPKPGDYHCFDLLGESVVSCAGTMGRSAAFTTCAATVPRACSTDPRATAAGASPAPITRGPTRSTAASSACPIARLVPRPAITEQHGLVAARAGNLHGLHLRPLRARAAERARDGCTLRR